MNQFRWLINPYGFFDDVSVISKGRLFDLYRATLDGRYVCLKAPKPRVNDAGTPAPRGQRVRMCRSNPATIGCGEYRGGPLGDGKPCDFRGCIVCDDPCFETSIRVGSEVFGHTSGGEEISILEIGLLLQMEVETIRSTAGAWNHDVIGMGAYRSFDGSPYEEKWRSGPSADELSYYPVAVMPLHAARPFSAYSCADRRRLFPLMLASLWDALCVQPHGDLSEGNVLLDDAGERFVLIDPGVFIGGEGRGRSLFTTNRANYPILFPHQYVLSGGWYDGLTLMQLALLGDFDLKLYEHNESADDIGKAIGNRSTKQRPSAADLQALGFMYFRILTNGNELSPVFGIETEPAWYGGFVSPRRFPLQVRYQNHVNSVTLSTLDKTLSKFSSGVAALVRALVLLEVKTRDQLLELVRQAVDRRGSAYAFTVAETL